MVGGRGKQTSEMKTLYLFQYNLHLNQVFSLLSTISVLFIKPQKYIIHLSIIKMINSVWQEYIFTTKMGGRGLEETLGGDGCLLSWLWWPFHRYMCISKPIKYLCLTQFSPNPSNIYVSPRIIKYTWVKLGLLKYNPYPKTLLWLWNGTKYVWEWGDELGNWDWRTYITIYERDN